MAADLQKRCIRAMDALDAATSLLELRAPGLGVHPPKGDRAGRHGLSVSGPWRITLRWEGRTRKTWTSSSITDVPRSKARWTVPQAFSAVWRR